MRQDKVVRHGNDACLDWVTDKILYKGKPTPKWYVDGTVVRRTSRPPSFILVAITGRRCLGYPGENSGVSLSLTLMDGCNSIFCATTSALVSPAIGNREPAPGYTITVHNYDIVDLQDLNTAGWRFIMVVNSLSWIAPIRMRPSDHGPKSTPEKLYRAPLPIPDPWKSVCISREPLDLAEGQQLISFTERLPLNGRSGLMHQLLKRTPCVIQLPSQSNLRAGTWIADPISRYDWENYKEDGVLSIDPECQCCWRYGMMTCVTKSFPINQLDTAAVISSNSHRPGASHHLVFQDTDWFMLSNKSKQWCLFWWYTVNVFQQCPNPLTVASDGTYLTACVTSHIRNEFPLSNIESFVGWEVPK